MERTVFLRTLVFSFVAATTAVAGPVDFNMTTLVTSATDGQLINPWGIAASATSPFWIASNGSGVSELYNTLGVKQGLVVTIPGAGDVTGVAFNGFGGFNGDNFLFVSEDGTVSGWRGALGTNAETLQTASTNVFKGLAVESVGGNTYALLANFHNGTIDILKGGVSPNLTGAFTDPTLPAGYAPFDVQNLNGVVYVTYAKQDAARHDEIAGAGFGFVDTFTPSGVFVSRLVSQGALNAPWGLAIAPNGFGDVGGDLLVGNFGDGRINAYDATSGAFRETLLGSNGNPLVIDGLWGLRFGNGGNGGNLSSLYITAGPNNEAGGLFAQLDPVPEPTTALLTGCGLLLAGALRKLKK